LVEQEEVVGADLLADDAVAFERLPGRAPRRRNGPQARGARIHYGGGAPCATVQQAAMAVGHRVADVVVCYRAFNERSGRRFGAGVQDHPTNPSAEGAHFAWYSPHGLVTPAQWVAMFARRYMHAYGATSEDFGRSRWWTAGTLR